MASRPPRAPSSSPRQRRAAAKSAVTEKAKSSDLGQWTPGARAILRAAVAVFSTEGFDSVSIAQIAERAGVSKANIFHHFESKDALYLAVMRDACTAHANFAEELHARPISSVTKLKLLIDFELEFQIDCHPYVKMMTRELLDGHARVKSLARNTMRRNFLAVTALIKQGIESGEFAPDLDPTMGAMLVHSATSYFFMTRHVIREFPGAAILADAKSYSEQIFKYLLRSVGTGKAPG